MAVVMQVVCVRRDCAGGGTAWPGFKKSGNMGLESGIFLKYKKSAALRQGLGKHFLYSDF